MLKYGTASHPSPHHLPQYEAKKCPPQCLLTQQRCFLSQLFTLWKKGMYTRACLSRINLPTQNWKILWMIPSTSKRKNVLTQNIGMHTCLFAETRWYARGCRGKDFRDRMLQFCHRSQFPGLKKGWRERPSPRVMGNNGRDGDSGNALVCGDEDMPCS